MVPKFHPLHGDILAKARLLMQQLHQITNTLNYRRAFLYRIRLSSTHQFMTWMDRWRGGMMEACGGNIKAWDVVNEAISGGDSDGDGVYDLQHYNGNDADFFWQDHMGDLEYVRQAVRLARLHYANSMASKGGDDGK